MEEFFEEEAGEALGMVADDAVFFQEIVEDDAEAEFLEGGKYRRPRVRRPARDKRRATSGDTAWRLATTPIDDPARNMLLDDAQDDRPGRNRRFRRACVIKLAIYRRAEAVDLAMGRGNFRDQQVWKNAGVERAGAEKYQVSLLDGFDGLGKRARTPREESLSFFDRHFAGGDLRFAMKRCGPFSSVATRCTF